MYYWTTASDLIMGSMDKLKVNNRNEMLVPIDLPDLSLVTIDLGIIAVIYHICRAIICRLIVALTATQNTYASLPTQLGNVRNHVRM